MIPFARRADGIHLTLSAPERTMLASLVGQLRQILADELGDDPAARRMFPDAYPDDPEASAEFRRYTQDDLRTQKTENARRVHELLTTAAPDGPLDHGDEQAWLRSLTDLRLVVAERLGIADVDPDDDPDGTGPGARLRDVYDWLGYVQETLVGTLLRR